MSFDIRSLDGTSYLLDPTWCKRYALRLEAFPICPTSRELASEHMKRMDIARNAATQAVRGVKGKVGVIPVRGLIEQRVTPQMMKLGGTSTEEISAMLDAMIADKSIDAIIMDVDSPGGTIYGIEELSDKIFNARDKKRTYAIANSLAASAAYWVASSAGMFAASPGADVGSIGVYGVHIDESKALEAEGITVTMIHAGKFKTELSPYSALSPEARDYAQTQVDATYAKFTNAVKRNRNTSIDDVRKNYGQGRMMGADQAKAAGMVDRVMTFEELLGGLLGGSTHGGKKSAEAVGMLRLRHEQREREFDTGSAIG